MKSIKFFLYILSIVLLFSCKKDDDKIEFTFLQINDVYEIAPIQGGEFGGMARVETVHQKLLEENKNTMLFMAGDFLNPSLIGTIKVDGERVRGRQMVEVMNAMSFDLVAFGNHEFDVSQEDLQKRLNESNFPWISANVKLKTKEKSISFYKEVEGKQISLDETWFYKCLHSFKSGRICRIRKYVCKSASVLCSYKRFCGCCFWFNACKIDK
jgi:5'-nucleotidase/UDP-sugar diphosphatase